MEYRKGIQLPSAAGQGLQLHHRRHPHQGQTLVGRHCLVLLPRVRERCAAWAGKRQVHDPLRVTLTRDACCRDGAAQGIWPAHWMMPDVEACWPDVGEMDILEMINGDGRVHATYHWEANYPAKNCSQVRVRRCLEPPMFECGGTVMYCHS